MPPCPAGRLMWLRWGQGQAVAKAACGCARGDRGVVVWPHGKWRRCAVVWCGWREFSCMLLLYGVPVARMVRACNRR